LNNNLLFHYSCESGKVEIIAEKQERIKLGTAVRTDHRSKTAYSKRATRFNRGVKKGRSILAVGDEPMAALICVNPEPSEAPFLHKLGHLQIKINDRLLEEAENIRTVFTPWGADWTINFTENRDQVFYLKTVITDQGFNAVFETSGDVIWQDVEIIYGGFLFGERTFQPEYFVERPDNLIPVVAETVKTRDMDYIKISALDGGFNYTGNPPVTEYAGFTVFGGISAVSGGFGIYRIKIKKDEKYGICARFADEKKTILFPENKPALDREINREKQRFEKLLAACPSDVPDNILDLALKHAVLNMDYLYTGSAWFEGGHWWNSYFTNNNQISAAIALMDFSKARNALLYFGLKEKGYGVILADGQLDPNGTFSDGREDFLAYDGIPYYLHQLYEYVDATGDTGLFDVVCENVIKMIESLELSRMNNGLYSWHRACNMFLYQADHLQLPGASSSVSLMMAGIYKKLSVLLGKTGKNRQALLYIKKSENILAKTIAKLWDKERKFFVSHEDWQGHKHFGHYYTDLVFPALYTDLPPEYAERSLDHLKRTLFIKADSGNLLMRVGDLKPSLFGNDNVMPTQMAETARAFAKYGEAAVCGELLKSIALAATVYTEAPGSFPERLSDDGKGEYNYMFGNPAGAYIYAYICGLFGIRAGDYGKCLYVSPAFPPDWDKAELQLLYGGLKYRRSGKVLEYYINADQRFKTVIFSVCLDPIENLDISINGKAGEYTVEHRLTRDVVSIRIDQQFLVSGGEYRVRIIPLYRKIAEIEKNECGDGPAHKPCDSISGKNLSWELLSSKPLDMDHLLINETIRASSAWRQDNEYKPCFSGIDRNSNIMEIAGGSFKIIPAENGTGYLKFLRVAFGYSDPITGFTRHFNDCSNHARIPVRRQVKKIFFFMMTEADARLTYSKIGYMCFAYSDGSTVYMDLVQGKNISSLIEPFAADAVAIVPAKESADCGFILAMDGDNSKTLSYIDIDINTSDADVAIFAVNILT
jgi:hypothetical protein